MIDWQNLFKIRIANSDESMQKHEVIKLLLVMKLLKEHIREKNFIRIYTEFEVMEGVRCDVYYENTRTKEAFAFEIQKKYTKLWLNEKKETYKRWDQYLMKSCDWIPINLNDCPDKIDEINSWLDAYIV